jgi:endonuclease/exonuclease/phosphatase family metal-dependent hydrolase
MEAQIKKWPLVPGGSGDPADDGKRKSSRTRGAKNLRALRQSSRQKTSANVKKDSDYKLNILTYNIRTLRTEERLIELENSLKNINWDILGLSEVRRDGEDIVERENTIFFYCGNSSGQSGVGFLVHKKWKDNILEFTSYSDRIAVLKFKLSEKQTITVVQSYAPTSTHPDEEVEDFYDLLNRACDEHRSTYNLIIGDFNAKIGKRQELDDTTVVGPHGLGDRNIRGSRLMQFAFGQKFQISNSFFFKKPQRRWTWVSPNSLTTNEIDYILSSNNQIIKNIETINNIKFSSDHRPLRAKVVFNSRIYRKQLIFKSLIRKHDKNTLITHKQKFNLQLSNYFEALDNGDENVDSQYNNIIKSVKHASNKIKPTKNKHKKLTEQTLRLIEDRQLLHISRNSLEYRTKDKEVKRSIRTDIRNYRTRLVELALNKNTSLKNAKDGASHGKSWITSLKDINGTRQSDRNKILNIATQYYKTLYSDPLRPHPSSSFSAIEESFKAIPPITDHEVYLALHKMKYGKSPGGDGITTEALKVGGPTLIPYLSKLFNTIITTHTFPQHMCHSNIILLHKKGGKSDIGNYRPISLVSHVYKIFLKIIESRISGTLDHQQPPEQAGFRPGLSTTDHLHALNQIIEKCQEHNIPIYLAFVDYSKAFDSLSHNSIFTALHNQCIDPSYIQLITTIYKNSTAAIKLQSSGTTFDIQKGVKQGDPLSPKLFTSTLEDVFRKLMPSWRDRGVVIGERILTNLRFADDIVLFSSTPSELRLMLQDLSNASLEVGLTMNMSKTKLMTNSTARRIEINGESIAYVQEYLYLGQIVSFQARQEKEVERRTENAWRTYWSMKHLMKGDLPISLKRRLMDMCILPILTYGAQTWSLTLSQKSKLGVCQRAMERSILGVKLMDRIRNTTLRSKTQIIDVARKAAKLKWDWAGHVCRMPSELWAKTATEWQPDNSKRRRGRPRRRWRDEIDSFLKDWPEAARDRDAWKRRGEAFAQQWDTIGS